jgi:type II secretory pathway pseudopilin PulG
MRNLLWFRHQKDTSSDLRLPYQTPVIELAKLVVIAIIAILAAILFPVFAQAREKARQTACLSNTKQIGTALAMYVQDFDETIPFNDNGPDFNPGKAQCAFDILQPYIKNTQVYVCPSAKPEDKVPIFMNYDNTNRPLFSYAINNMYWNVPEQRLFEKESPATLASIEDTVGTIFCGDSKPAVNQQHWAWQVTGTVLNTTVTPPILGFPDYQGQFVARHNGGICFTFFDSHAKWMKLEKATEKDATTGTALRYFTKTLD